MKLFWTGLPVFTQPKKKKKKEDWIAATFSAYFRIKLISTSMPVTSFTKIAMSCA